jgi:hypothetical protein
MTVVLLDGEHRGQPDEALVMGEDPDDAVRRPISRLKRSSGLVLLSLRQWSAGNA